MGGNHDPRLPDSHPDLRAKMITPDVLIQPHSAPLGFAFYNGEQFPAEYRGDEFLALHGSWNRASRTGMRACGSRYMARARPPANTRTSRPASLLTTAKVWAGPWGSPARKIDHCWSTAT